MRTVPQQPSLRPVFIPHERSCEYFEMDRLLVQCPEAVAAAEGDLLAGVGNPETGCPGMTAEQVIRVYLVRRQNGFGYDALGARCA